jgi:hypothetical protein
LHNHGDSWAATWSGTSLPRVTGSAGIHRSGAPTGPQPLRPTKRQATDILVLVSTDIPVRFPLTSSCVFTAGRRGLPGGAVCHASNDATVQDLPI